MTRPSNPRILLAPVLAAAALLLAPPAATASPPAVDPGDVVITRVDTSAYPSVTTDLAVPATLPVGAFSSRDVTVVESGTAIDADVTVIAPNRLEVVLLFDTSGSMDEGGAIAFARYAAEQFIGFLPEGTQMGIVGFGTTPSLVSPLTDNKAQLLQAVAGMRAGGKTSLYDAVVFGQQLFSGSSEDRHFVVLTDGGDTASIASLDEAVAVSGGIRTSVIELVTSESDHAAVERLAAAANGTVSSATDGVALGELFRAVADDLVNRVRVTFATAATGDTAYTFRVSTPTGTIEATTVLSLPAAAAPTTTAATTVPPTTEPAVVAPAAPPTSQPTTPVRDTRRTTSDIANAPATGRSSDPPLVLLAIGAAAVFAGTVLALMAAILRPPDTRSARRRLGAPEPERETNLTERITNAADRWLARDERAGRLASLMDTAGVALRPGELVVLVLAGAVAATVVMLLLLGPIGVLVGPPITPLLAWITLRVKRDNRRRAFADQLPDVLQLIVSSLRAGFGLPQALASAAEQASEPCRTELQRVQFEARIGRDPSEALRAVAERMASPDFEWVVAAIDINREIGGELAQILDHVAATIRERQRLERQIRTLTAEGRLSAYVLTALPFAMFVVLGAMNPDYFEPLTHGPGLALVILGLVLLLFGWLWMRRLIKAQL